MIAKSITTVLESKIRGKVGINVKPDKKYFKNLIVDVVKWLEEWQKNVHQWTRCVSIHDKYIYLNSQASRN